MTFYETLTAAVQDLTEHGFDTIERLDRWTEALRQAAEASMLSPAKMRDQLVRGLQAIYHALIDKNGLAQYHPGVSRYTLQKLQPKLRHELDRRILASAQLIKLNREQAIGKTLQRFSGWATSIPPGGSKVVDKPEVKHDVRKALAQLPYEERRVLIDQGHKFTAELNNIVAVGSGALAAKWNSHFRQKGYDARPDHAHRDQDGAIYAVRGNWAIEKGLMKVGPAGYTDQITSPGEEVFCFPGDSRLEFFDDVEKLYRRWYDGDVITITTSSGRTLRATPNHPVLTSKGWVATGLLNEGDNLVEIGHEGVEASKLNTDDCETLFSDFFDAMLRVDHTLEIRQGVRPDFHGDGSDQDIDVITLTRPLGFYGLPEFTQSSKQKLFAHADLLTACISVVKKGLKWFNLAANGGVGDLLLSKLVSLNGLCRTASFFQAFHDSGRGHSKGLSKLAGCFARVVSPQKLDPINVNSSHTAKTGTKVNKPSLVTLPDSHGTDTASVSDLIDGFAGCAKLGYIVKVDRDHFSGHVYNLQTESGWYAVNGIIVSNCRCWYTYLYRLSALPPVMITAKGQNELARVKEALANGP